MSTKLSRNCGFVKFNSISVVSGETDTLDVSKLFNWFNLLLYMWIIVWAVFSVAMSYKIIHRLIIVYQFLSTLSLFCKFLNCWDGMLLIKLAEHQRKTFSFSHHLFCLCNTHVQLKTIQLAANKYNFAMVQNCLSLTTCRRRYCIKFCVRRKNFLACHIALVTCDEP